MSHNVYELKARRRDNPILGLTDLRISVFIASMYVCEVWNCHSAYLLLVAIQPITSVMFPFLGVLLGSCRARV